MDMKGLFSLIKTKYYSKKSPNINYPLPSKLLDLIIKFYLETKSPSISVLNLELITISRKELLCI